MANRAIAHEALSLSTTDRTDFFGQLITTLTDLTISNAKHAEIPTNDALPVTLRGARHA